MFQMSNVDVNAVNWEQIANQQNGNGQNANDGCVPLFYMKAVLDPAATAEYGTPKHKLAPYVKILTPGDKSNVPNRPVSDDDKRRWPTQWRAFEMRQETVVSGTPVEQWPYLTPERVADLKAQNILTVEALASAPEAIVTRVFMDGLDLQSRARQFLKPQSEVETELRQKILAMEADKKQRDAEIDMMMKKIAALEENQSKKGKN